MNQSHYPSLELCKKLTEIGFSETGLTYEGLELLADIKPRPAKEKYLRCPSVMEMLDVMPTFIKEKDDNFLLDIWGIGREPREFGVKYETVRGKQKRWFCSEVLPNALAEMILWLHENNYISFNK